jgi:cytochrome P450
MTISLKVTTQSISLITALFLALTRYPEVQRKAQAELDTVVPRKRLPTFGDRPHLPYIEAFCRELSRWHVVIPLGAYFFCELPD